MYKYLSISPFVSIFPLLYQNPATAITLGFSPSSQTTNLGSQVTVDLVVSDLGNNTAPSLGEFDVVLGFDADIIAFDSLEFGDQLNPTSSIFAFRGETFFPPDSLNLFEISGQTSAELIQFQPSSFTLATFTFDGVGIGTSDLILSNVILGDTAGNQLTPVIEPGSITVIADVVTTVPEASTTLALLSLGLTMILPRRHSS